MAYGDLKVRNLIWNTGSGDNTVVLNTLATQSYVTTGFAPKANPTFTGTVNGADLILSGNLTVNGTQTIINTQTLDVEDKQIEIGKVSSPSDTTANEGGWKLKGASDKTFLWYNSTDAWTSSEHIHLGDNKKLLFGVGAGGIQDLSIYSNGTEGILETQDGGTIKIKDGNNTFATFAGAGNQIDFHKHIVFIGNSANAAWDFANSRFSGNGGGLTHLNLGQANNTGTVATARLGSGTANSGTFLAGDNTWQAISAAPEITATASGAVTAGKTMMINSNGTTSQVTSTLVTADPPVMEPETSAHTLVSSSPQNMKLAVDTDSNKLFITWKHGSGDVTYGKIATINADGSLTLGATATLVSGASSGASGTDVCYVGSGKFIIMYRDQSNSDYATIQMISYANDLSITVGNKNLVTSSSSGQPCDTRCAINYDASQDKVIMMFRQPSGGVLQFYFGGVDQSDVNDPVPTMATSWPWYADGAQQSYFTADGSNTSCYDPDTEQVIFQFKRSNGSEFRAQALKWDSANNRYAFGSSTVVHSGNVIGGTCVEYDTDTNTLVYLFSENSILRARAATVDTSGAFTFGTTVNIVSFATGFHTLTSTNNGKLGVLYRDTSSSNHLASKTLTISGTRTITVGSGVARLSTVAEPSIGKYSAHSSKIYYVSMNDSAGDLNFYSTTSISTTAGGYVGIANNSASNGQSVVIRTFGATNNNQSGLTAGTLYYIQKNGTLGTAADTPSVEAGIALSSTKLLIKG